MRSDTERFNCLPFSADHNKLQARFTSHRNFAKLHSTAQTTSVPARNGGLSQQLSLNDLVTTALCLCYTGETTQASRCAQVTHSRISEPSTALSVRRSEQSRVWRPACDPLRRRRSHKRATLVERKHGSSGPAITENTNDRGSHASIVVHAALRT